MLLQSWYERSGSIIGDDSTLAIKLGKDAGKLLGAEDQATADTIAVRGVASDVTRAIKDIHRIVESAKNDEIDNGYVRPHDPVLEPVLTVVVVRRVPYPSRVRWPHRRCAGRRCQQAPRVARHRS